MASYNEDRPPILPHMPDFSLPTPTKTAGIPSAADLKFHLQALLDAKEKQLQQAATFGSRVLAQRVELEQRIRQLQDLEADHSDEEDMDTEGRERYRELQDTIRAWDSENAQLTTAFLGSSKQRALNGNQSSLPVDFVDLPREEPERIKPPAGTSAAQSRRAKNAAHRADDVEFAFEIGSGLLTEVRRLQSLLAERDKVIQDMKEEKDDLEKSVESLRTALREQEQGSDKYKEENWNLEVTLQELRTQLADSQSSTQRLESEHKRLTKALSTSRDAGEQHKIEGERLKTLLEELKAKHETDVAQARKHAASLQRDKSDLQSAVDKMKGEAAKAGRRGPRFGSPLTPDGRAGPGGKELFVTPVGLEDGDDVFSATGGLSTNGRRNKGEGMFDLGQDMFGVVDSPPDLSPARPAAAPFLTASHPSKEIEALQQRLAHAQRQIGTLKGTLQREKEMKMEYRRKLEGVRGVQGLDIEDEVEDGEGEGEGEGEDMYEDVEDAVPAVARRHQQPRRVTPFRRGRGRGRGIGGRSGLTLVQRLGMAAHSPSSEYNDNENRDDDGSPVPPVPPLPPIYFQGEDNIFVDNEAIEDEEDEEEHERAFQGSPSPSPNALDVRSNRTSVDGMDPAFANVLRRQNSFTSTASPLRQSMIARAGGRGARRRGVAYQTRPNSLVGQPEALAAELGLGFAGAGSGTSPGSPGLVGETILEDEFSGGREEREHREMEIQTEILAEDVLVRGEVEKEKEQAVLETPGIIVTPNKPELVEMGVQVDPVVEEKLEALPAPVPLPIPVPAPAPSKAEMGIQAEEVPAVERLDMGVQHELLTLISIGTNTEDVERAEVEVQTRGLETKTVDADVQTADVRRAEMEIQTEEEEGEGQQATLTQSDVSRASIGSVGDITLTRPPGRFFAEAGIGAHQQKRGSLGDEDDDGDGEETETGVDTDLDDYHDASQSVGMSTPSMSRDDFHSVMTLSDNDFSESDDGEESIRASRLPSRQGPASVSSTGRRSSYYPRVIIGGKDEAGEVDEDEDEDAGRGVQIEYDSKSVMVVPAEEPKPEVKEMSIQTDEWLQPPAVSVLAPALPLVTPSPAPVPLFVSPNAARSSGGVQQQQQQLQFVPPQFVPPPGTTNATAVAPGTISTLSASAVMSMPVPVPASASSISAFPGGSSVFRESSATFGRPRTSTSIRRKSIESSISSLLDEPARSRVSSNQLAGVVDKTKPPMMVLPPPPRAPPPPPLTSATNNNVNNFMPPPSYIPERRLRMSMSGTEGGAPPPRPSSPPPAELIQRATTPTFGSALSIPGRQGSFSLRSSQARLHQPSSTSSIRSGANATPASTALQSVSHPPSLNASLLAVKDLERRDGSIASPRSSMSSDHNPFGTTAGRSKAVPSAPETPNRMADTSMRSNGASTDPTIIHAITQTMIGEFLYKYTRRTIGKGHGEKRHRRFFWVHPYTKTLYWSSADPGSSNVSESSAKSAYIEGVRSVLDPNPMPPGLYQYSVVVSTPQREMKITAPTKERHDIWLNALRYLLSRPNPTNIMSPNAATVPESPVTDTELRNYASPQSQRSGRSILPGSDQWNTTPRGQRSRSQLSFRGSVGKRSGTPALEYLRWNGPESPFSPSKSFEHVQKAAREEDEEDEELDFELHGDSRSDEGFEGLENVRACCDGRHTVGHSGKVHQHHQHHQHHHNPSEQNGVQRHHPQPSQTAQQHLEVQQPENTRPASPAWSFRSRAGSTHSGEGSAAATGIFSWGRGEDGRLRFGSRRATKTVPSHDQ